MHEQIMPPELPAPAANYAYGVVATNPSRWLHTAGVVGIDRDGTVPPTVALQARVVWSNLATILAAAGMGPDDIVSISTFVVASAMGTGLPEAMAERDAFMAGRLVASTFVTVPALVRPEWLIEIAVIAAR
jgi:enamine deaminase RidA (YjgF/YER057c/UK114 family)